jgi:hypothetical protein
MADPGWSATCRTSAEGHYHGVGICAALVREHRFQRREMIYGRLNAFTRTS